MDIQRKYVPFQVKSTSEDGSTGQGLASAFHNVDAYGDIIDPGAFDADLAAFLSDGFVSGMNHDWNEPIGKPTSAAATREGLAVSWKLSPTAHGKDVMVLLRDRVVKKLSIGFQTLGEELLTTLDDVMSYWRGKGYTPSADDIARAQGGANLLTRIRLLEFGPVVLPANSLATITSVKSREGTNAQDVRNYERWLRQEFGYTQNAAKTHIGKAKGILRGDQVSLGSIERRNHQALIRHLHQQFEATSRQIDSWRGRRVKALTPALERVKTELDQQNLQAEIDNFLRQAAQAQSARKGRAIRVYK